MPEVFGLCGQALKVDPLHHGLGSEMEYQDRIVRG
jgi:hypothetical protein